MASADIELSERESVHLSEMLSNMRCSSVEAPGNAQPAMLPVSPQRQLTILMCAFFDVFIAIGMNQA